MKKSKLFIFLLLLILLASTSSADQNNDHLYVSWQGPEADKASSTWLIKNFIDKDAQFKYVEYGSEIKTGFSFDVPGSKFSRNHMQSTFDTLVKEYNITDPAILKLAKVIHDIELNTWRPKTLKESVILDYQWIKVQKKYKEKTPPLSCILEFYGLVYEQFTLKNKPFDISDQQLTKICNIKSE